MSVLLHSRGILTKQTVSGGGSGKTPDQVTGLFAWWKADAGTSSTVDGTALSQWDDSSGNGRHLVQATAGNRPVYKASILNSKPVVRFTAASSHYMRWTGSPPGEANPSSLSIFVVAKINTAGNNTPISTRDGGATGWIFRLTATGLLFGHLGGSNVTDSFTSTNWNIAELVRTNLSAVLGHNGTMAGAQTITAYPTNASTEIHIGGEDNSGPGVPHDPQTNFFDGDIAEMAIYNTAVSSTDRDDLETGWASKYGITVA